MRGGGGGGTGGLTQGAQPKDQTQRGHTAHWERTQTGSTRTLPTGLQNSTSLSSLKEATTHRRDQLEVQSANSGSCEKQLWKEL